MRFLTTVTWITASILVGLYFPPVTHADPESDFRKQNSVNQKCPDYFASAQFDTDYSNDVVKVRYLIDQQNRAWETSIKFGTCTLNTTPTQIDKTFRVAVKKYGRLLGYIEEKWKIEGNELVAYSRGVRDNSLINSVASYFGVGTKQYYEVIHAVPSSEVRRIVVATRRSAS